MSAENTQRNGDDDEKAGQSVFPGKKTEKKKHTFNKSRSHSRFESVSVSEKIPMNFSQYSTT